MGSDRTRRKARTFKRKNGGGLKRATTLGVWALTLGAVAFSSEETVAPKGTPDESAPETATCAPNVANGRGKNAPFARLIDDMRRADGWKIFEPTDARTVGSVAVELEAEIGVGVGDEIPIAAPERVAVDLAPTALCSRWARFKPGSWARLQTT
ncbi:MAG: hypothetical protein IKW13_05795, partial [Thermoguttaceae bacterium]|nr:hypothetical protein [Thermoguttaceae bacterium]